MLTDSNEIFREVQLFASQQNSGIYGTQMA